MGNTYIDKGGWDTQVLWWIISRGGLTIHWRGSNLSPEFNFVLCSKHLFSVEVKRVVQKLVEP